MEWSEKPQAENIKRSHIGSFARETDKSRLQPRCQRFLIEKVPRKMSISQSNH